VREIGRNTGSVDNIVEGELIDEGARLEEKGERLETSTAVRLDLLLIKDVLTICTHLANATRSTSNNCARSSQLVEFGHTARANKQSSVLRGWRGRRTSFDHFGD
jgi:hypothetical protein